MRGMLQKTVVLPGWFMTSAMVYVDSHYYIVLLITEIMNCLLYLQNGFSYFLVKIASFAVIYR